MTTVQFAISEQVAVLTLAHPPVNSLGAELRRSLLCALQRAEDDVNVRAIVLIGAGKGFSAGADIRELGTPNASAPPNLADLIRAIEMSAKPVIAGVSGVCMGGGLELALGCHYRIGARGARIALPEVKLGLLPGSGGTQRLPRLLGVEKALNMIVSGATVLAENLRDSGLFNGFSDGDLLESCLRFARQLIREAHVPQRVRDLGIHEPHAEAYLQFVRNTVKGTSGPYPAPLACVDAVAAAVHEPFDAGLKHERELFQRLMRSSESAALRHVFQAERAASRIADVPKNTDTRPIHKLAVIGAGTMGVGITMSLINAGLPVALLETNREALDRGLANIRRNYQGALRKGALSEAALAVRLALITPALDFAMLRDVDCVIEAVFESLEAKKEVFGQLDRVIRPGGLLATNTSALNLDTIASFTSRPQDVIGLHFFSPAQVMRLLEVVRGAKTAPQVLATAMQLARQLGKIAVVARVCDGFIGNRMLARYASAAHDMLVAGASPRQVDEALQRFGMAMGPFRMGDLAGLDIGWAARKRRALELPDRDFSSAADDLCEEGRFGQKTGAGWYRYEAGSREAIPDPHVEKIIERFRAKKGIRQRTVANEEIVERCIYALVNEGARILADGIAQRGSDIDLVYLNGYGFPAHRGGPLFYADGVGLPEVARAMRKIAAAPGVDKVFWTPAPLLVQLADDCQTLSGYERRTP
jgi:3-hydroxyacyl-CoA dehydrogenase